VKVGATLRNSSGSLEVGSRNSTIGRSEAFLEPCLKALAGSLQKTENSLEITHRQADGGGDGGREFVWDGSMEPGLMDAINTESGAGEPEAGHVHGPDCGHSYQEDPTPDMAELESNLIEVAYALAERYGDAGPTPEQERQFMREWLLGKGRSQEEVDLILAE
jgi:hypothetical protein